MEGHVGIIPAVLPVTGRAAVVLHEQAELICAVYAEHLLQALVYERILAPLARNPTKVVEVVPAPLQAHAE